MYKILTTPPDLAFVVSYLSRFPSAPHRLLITAIRHLMRYVQGSLNTKLNYSREVTSLVGYSHADY